MLHECTVNPVYNEEYRSIMRNRAENYQKPIRTVQFLTESDSRSANYITNTSAKTLGEIGVIIIIFIKK